LIRNDVFIAAFTAIRSDANSVDRMPNVDAAVSEFDSLYSHNLPLCFVCDGKWIKFCSALEFGKISEMWFRDFAEDIKKYEGKIVKFKGICGVSKKMKQGTVICGRHVMTCCIDDIEFKGLVCVGMPKDIGIKNKDWAVITAKIVMEHHELYSKVGPVLHILEAQKSHSPDEEIATFF